MIITRTPLRISFVGGGSDFPDFYNKYPGKVISTTINKYVYIVIHPAPLQDKIMVRYSTIEIVDKVDQIKNDRVREVLKYFKINKPIEIGVYSDLPVGTGLGGSSAFTVGLIKGLAPKLSKVKIAELAYQIEKKISPLGKQDQYAASFGGLNKFVFTNKYTKVASARYSKQKLLNHCLLLYTGITRQSQDILSQQKKNTVKNTEVLKKMVDLVDEFQHSESYKNFGKLLHQNWILKKQLASNISDSNFDKLYEKALKSGAWGGKILGAGGGGCFLFICPKNKRQKIKKALGLKEIPFNFTDKGAEVIYDQ